MKTDAQIDRQEGDLVFASFRSPMVQAIDVEDLQQNVHRAMTGCRPGHAITVILDMTGISSLSDDAVAPLGRLATELHDRDGQLILHSVVAAVATRLSDLVPTLQIVESEMEAFEAYRPQITAQDIEEIRAHGYTIADVIEI